MKIYVPEEEELPQPTYETDTSPMDPRAKLVFFVILPLLFVVLIGSIYFGVKGGEYESFSILTPLKKFATELDKSMRETFKIDGRFPRSPDQFPTSKPLPSATPAITKTVSPTSVPSATPAQPRITIIPTKRANQPQYRFVSPTPFVFPTIPPGSLGSKEWEEEFNRKFEEVKKRIEESNKKVQEDRQKFCNDNPTSGLCN